MRQESIESNIFSLITEDISSNRRINLELNRHDIQIEFGSVDVSVGGAITVTFQKAFESGTDPIVLAFAEETGTTSAQVSRTVHTANLSNTSCTFETRELVDSGVGTTDIDDGNSVRVHYMAIGLARNL